MPPTSFKLHYTCIHYRMVHTTDILRATLQCFLWYILELLAHWTHVGITFENESKQCPSFGYFFFLSCLVLSLPCFFFPFLGVFCFLLALTSFLLALASLQLSPVPRNLSGSVYKSAQNMLSSAGWGPSIHICILLFFARYAVSPHCVVLKASDASTLQTNIIPTGDFTVQL